MADYSKSNLLIVIVLYSCAGNSESCNCCIPKRLSGIVKNRPEGTVDHYAIYNCATRIRLYEAPQWSLVDNSTALLKSIYLSCNGNKNTSAISLRLYNPSFVSKQEKIIIHKTNQVCVDVFNGVSIDAASNIGSIASTIILVGSAAVHGPSWVMLWALLIFSGRCNAYQDLSIVLDYVQSSQVVGDTPVTLSAKESIVTLASSELYRTCDWDVKLYQASYECCGAIEGDLTCPSEYDRNVFRFSSLPEWKCKTFFNLYPFLWGKLGCWCRSTEIENQLAVVPGDKCLTDYITVYQIEMQDIISPIVVSLPDCSISIKSNVMYKHRHHVLQCGYNFTIDVGPASTLPTLPLSKIVCKVNSSCVFFDAPNYGEGRPGRLGDCAYHEGHIESTWYSNTGIQLVSPEFGTKLQVSYAAEDKGYTAFSDGSQGNEVITPPFGCRLDDEKSMRGCSVGFIPVHMYFLSGFDRVSSLIRKPSISSLTAKCSGYSNVIGGVLIQMTIIYSDYGICNVSGVVCNSNYIYLNGNRSFNLQCTQPHDKTEYDESITICGVKKEVSCNLKVHRLGHFSKEAYGVDGDMRFIKQPIDWDFSDLFGLGKVWTIIIYLIVACLVFIMLFCLCSRLI